MGLGRAFRASRPPLWPQFPGCVASTHFSVIPQRRSSSLLCPCRSPRDGEAVHPPLSLSRSGAIGRAPDPFGSWRAPFLAAHSAPFLPHPDSISKMTDVEENMPLKDPGDAESGPCKPETSGPTRQDMSSPKNHPFSRSSPAGPGPRGA